MPQSIKIRRKCVISVQSNQAQTFLLIVMTAYLNQLISALSWGRMADDDHQADICRVCRCEGCSERPLFYPCICTGSIKYIHQECLVQWMRYSRKEYCELCGYRFSFTPIYSPDMPRRLPMRDVAAGLLSSVATAVKYVLKNTRIKIFSSHEHNFNLKKKYYVL